MTTTTNGAPTVAQLLAIADIADRLGVKPVAVRNYHHLAQKRRRAGEPALPGDMPAPDLVLGRTPAWEPGTIDAWIKTRPGQGYGGGRPPRDHAERK